MPYQWSFHSKLTCLLAQAPLRIKATDCSALRAPASLRSASVGAKRVPLARSALPVF